MPFGEHCQDPMGTPPPNPPCPSGFHAADRCRADLIWFGASCAEKGTDPEEEEEDIQRPCTMHTRHYNTHIQPPGRGRAALLPRAACRPPAALLGSLPPPIAALLPWSACHPWEALLSRLPSPSSPPPPGNLPPTCSPLPPGGMMATPLWHDGCTPVA